MAKKAKKRGVKPGTKRGPYKKKGRKSKRVMTLAEYSEKILKPSVEAYVEKHPEIKQYAPAPVLTLCGQLEDSILLLEQRISNAIAKINSLM